MKLVRIIAFPTEMETLKRTQHKHEHDKTRETQERQREVEEPVTNKKMTISLIAAGKVMKSTVTRQT